MGWLSGFRGQTSIVKPYNYATGGCVWESNSGSVSGQSRTPPGGVITPSSPLILDSVTNDTNFQGYTIPKSTIDINILICIFLHILIFDNIQYLIMELYLMAKTRLILSIH